MAHLLHSSDIFSNGNEVPQHSWAHGPAGTQWPRQGDAGQLLDPTLSSCAMDVVDTLWAGTCMIISHCSLSGQPCLSSTPVEPDCLPF